MREIFLVSGDSTESSLVFKTSEEDGAEEFFIAVTDELRAVLTGNGVTNIEPTIEPGTPVLSAVVSDGQHTVEHNDTDDVEETTDTVATQTTVARAVPPTYGSREEREIDPRISAPLIMSPREIQARIRSGATIETLAEENGVTEARIEPYAHPVLLERSRIAELAKQSHPVRDNGPAKLTLWEILATAFATRGHDLTTARWDAYRDATNQWIVRVDWKAGLSDNHAEWTLNLHNTSAPTADPRTPVAADLIDPEFIQQVRTLTSVGGNRYADDDDFEDYPDQPDDRDSEGQDTGEQTTDRGEHVEESASGQSPATDPIGEEAPRSRRRKAVTPHWEDVLLGVRANTKRPKK